MRWAYQGREVLSAVPDESQGRVAVGLDQQGVCPASRDTFENDFGYRITRTEIMAYLSQMYGPVFVDDLIKHLRSSSDGTKQPERMSVRSTAPAPRAP